jgi:hypothetical protein
MKERSQQLLSDVGGNINLITGGIVRLSEYISELEGLIEQYRAYLSKAKLSTMDDMAGKLNLLAMTDKIVGPPPEQPPTTT